MNALAPLHARPLFTLSSARGSGDGAVGATTAVAAQAPQAVDAAPRAVETASPQRDLRPPRLVIELDEAAARFVQTLLDGAGERVLRRYPDEAQLAFSRGISAYMAAVARR